LKRRAQRIEVLPGTDSFYVPSPAKRKIAE